MTYELTADGLSTETQEEIAARIASKLRAVLGPSLNTSTDSQFGQVVNIIAEEAALNQQQNLQVYQSVDPSNATGVSLDQRAALTGSVREGATVSSVAGTLEFTSAGTANNGDLIENTDNSTQWQLTDGPHVSAGPWPESIPATFASVDTGPIIAGAGSTWGIVTAIPGIDDPPFLNASDDAALGSNEQTDPEFRVTRQIEMFSQNIGGRLAVAGAVSKVPGVTDARCYHNPNVQPTDSDGIPFKAFNVVVDTSPTPPGAALEQSIYDAMLTVMGVGGEAFAVALDGFFGSSTDLEGEAQPMAFNLIALKDIFVNVALDTTGTSEPISPNLATVVQEAIAERATIDFTSIDEDALTYKIQGIVADLAAEGEITGVVTSIVQLSEVATGGPFIDPVPVSIRQRADYDTANILVTVTP